MTEMNNSSDNTPQATEAEQPVELVKKTSSTKMILTLGIVAMMSGLLVVLTWQLTLGPITENKRIMTEKAIFKVVPGSYYKRIFLLNEKSQLQLEGIGEAIETNDKSIKFYAAFDEKHLLKGIAAGGSAQGYADAVQLLFGYEPDCECIRGFSIIKMAETPGLGDKILTDEKFLANFDALDASLNAEKTALKNEIVSVKSGTKQNPWEIDVISGATITSKAVAKAINQSSKQLLPRLASKLEQIKLLNASHPLEQTNNSTEDPNKPQE